MLLGQGLDDFAKFGKIVGYPAGDYVAVAHCWDVQADNDCVHMIAGGLGTVNYARKHLSTEEPEIIAVIRLRLTFRWGLFVRGLAPTGRWGLMQVEL